MAITVTLRVPAACAPLEAALKGLVALDRVILRKATLPALYEAGVTYRAEVVRPEKWQTPDQIMGAGKGDCEDLACWRVAELQNAGELARVRVVRTGPKRFHAIVQRENGAIEDPSKLLATKG